MPKKERVKELDKEQRIKKHGAKLKGKARENRIMEKPKNRRPYKYQWTKNIDDEEYDG
ncbi:hypothetical protein HZI73_00410 [Vallitalea pronyensis]|uniref:Uncharacterized protein n=1 Tax=Vallitalea pronyensis TaxID=1348613 RepID=A0A8J8SEY4_9FIRM|nr:hypothetical protein [Vallitalea pronyensis]QUI20862.1 hypothetical protein HZI73_00410 [Vallitalea pronyensis]